MRTTLHCRITASDKDAAYNCLACAVEKAGFVMTEFEWDVDVWMSGDEETDFSFTGDPINFLTSW